MSPEEEVELLLEAACSASRGLDVNGRVKADPGWFDLTPAERVELYERQLQSRRIEQAIDPEGGSSRWMKPMLIAQYARTPSITPRRSREWLRRSRHQAS